MGKQILCIACGRSPESEEDEMEFIETEDGCICPDCLEEDSEIPEGDQEDIINLDQDGELI